MTRDNGTGAYERPPSPGARRLDSATVLRCLGLRGQIHPVDALAWQFPDRESFEASAARDREVHGNDVLGPYETDAGVIGITDIRPQLRKQGCPVTSPELPDYRHGDLIPAARQA